MDVEEFVEGGEYIDKSEQMAWKVSRCRRMISSSVEVNRHLDMSRGMKRCIFGMSFMDIE